MCAHRYYYQYAHIGITIDSLSVLLSIVYRYSERGRNHGFGRYANAPWYLQISSPHHKAQQSHYIITPEWIKLDEQRNTQKNKIINIETRQTTQHKLTKSESKQTEKKHSPVVNPKQNKAMHASPDIQDVFHTTLEEQAGKTSPRMAHTAKYEEA